MNKNIKTGKITETETASYLKSWYDNTNEEFEIGINGTVINNMEMFQTYQSLILHVLTCKNHKNCCIFGVDKVIDFLITFPDDKNIKKVCQNIWDNPTHYYTFDKDDDYYYEFLKFLWVDIYGIEYRLTDLIVDHEINEVNKLLYEK